MGLLTGFLAWIFIGVDEFMKRGILATESFWESLKMLVNWREVVREFDNANRSN
jgi:hypothetical protein